MSSRTTDLLGIPRRHIKSGQRRIQCMSRRQCDGQDPAVGDWTKELEASVYEVDTSNDGDGRICCIVVLKDVVLKARWISQATPSLSQGWHGLRYDHREEYDLNSLVVSESNPVGSDGGPDNQAHLPHDPNQCPNQHHRDCRPQALLHVQLAFILGKVYSNVMTAYLSARTHTTAESAVISPDLRFIPNNTGSHQ
ncbi:hypothetical protein B0H10DRAFT_2199965 [Mycena sp. CBHHK59/15]|nr:hypothetical protein B0H10DRAFT_2199965 [Mycena sp. CBHHK59/15]